MPMGKNERKEMLIGPDRGLIPLLKSIELGDNYQIQKKWKAYVYVIHFSFHHHHGELFGENWVIAPKLSKTAFGEAKQQK